MLVKVYNSISCLLHLESSNGCQCKMKQKSLLSHAEESQVFTYYIYFLSFSGRSEPFLYFNTFLCKRVFESATILDSMQSSHPQNFADDRPPLSLESKRWSRDKVQPGLSILRCYSYCSCQCREKKFSNHQFLSSNHSVTYSCDWRCSLMWYKHFTH